MKILFKIIITYALLISIFSCSGPENSLKGKWINLTIKNQDSPVLCEIENKKLYMTFRDNSVKEKVYLKKKESILIQTSEAGSYSRYDFTTQGDKLILDELGNNVKQSWILYSYLKKKINTTVEKEKLTQLLSDNVWSIEVLDKQDSPTTRHLYEFVNYRRALHRFSSTKSEEKGYDPVEWKVFEVDGLVFAQFVDSFYTTLLITDLSNEKVKGLLLHEEGPIKVEMDRIMPQINNKTSLKNSLQGNWLSLGKQSKFSEIEFEGDLVYNSYTAFSKKNHTLESGDFQISYDGKLLIVNNLEGDKEKVIEIIKHEKDSLILKGRLTDEQEILYVKR